jgi:hypothetical protein
MTWVLGSGVPFGYAALISDIRVTWPDGTHKDALQKIYPVGRQMLVGFAGSVRLGFAMVEDMRRAFEASDAGVWFPRAAAWGWWRRGRRIFSSASVELRDLGCSLLLAGASATLNGFIGHISHVVVMRSPQFEPEFPRIGDWVSVGSGADHIYARQLAQYQQDKPADFMVTYGQGEVHMGRGGFAKMLAFTVGTALLKDPMRTVSEVLHVGLAFADRFDVSSVSPIGRELGPNDLAISWETFKTLCDQASLNAASATG